MPSATAKQRRAEKRANDKAREEEAKGDAELSREVAAFNALYEPQRGSLEARLRERDARWAAQAAEGETGDLMRGKGVAIDRQQRAHRVDNDGCKQGAGAHNNSSDAGTHARYTEEDSAPSAGQTGKAACVKTMALAPSSAGQQQQQQQLSGGGRAGANRTATATVTAAEQHQVQSEKAGANSERVRSKAITELLSLVQLEEPPTEPTAQRLFEEQVQIKIRRILKSQRQRQARRLQKKTNASTNKD